LFSIVRTELPEVSAMTAVAMDTARAPAHSQSEAVSATLLIFGAAALFVGTLFYARLTPALGLPALPAERGQALADALTLGPRKLALAGGFSFLGDGLLLAACVALASKGRRQASDLERAGWALMAVSVVVAIVFDSMTAALFWPLAHASDAAPFLAFKAWFDFLFAAADVPFGLGFIAVLWADARRASPLLAKPFSFVGLAIGAAAAISGLGYSAGVLHMPLVIGLSVTFGCLVLAVLGAQILRRGPIAA
jgi:hypothetical protein